MPDATKRLPARPSLEQLRKQAKERLDALRATTPAATLADAQHALASEYGFESWPRLVHHVESVQTARALEMYEALARDILAGYQGDDGAMQRLIAHYGVSYNIEQWRLRIRSHVDDARGSAAGEPTLADVHSMLAREHGFDSWTSFADALAQPSATGVDARLGLSKGPPFFRIDAERRTIEPSPPLSDRDWDVIFDVMRERRLTGIATSAMTDRAVEKLSRLDFVTSVNIGGAQQMSDDGLLHLGRMPQLEELELGGWHCPNTDRGLAMLEHLTALRKFHMGWAQRITDDGVVGLRACDDLESVNLMGTATGDGAIAALRGKRKLRSFHTGRMVTDAGLPLLHDLPVFKTWQNAEVHYGLTGLEGEPNDLMIDGPFTDTGLATLDGLAGVFRLQFFWHCPSITSDGLAALRDLPNLGWLGVPGERCDDTAMRHIVAIPRLRALGAQGTVATDAGFAALSRSQSLEHIWGRECPNLTGRGFAALANLPRLRGLAVSCKQVDDEALATLPSFPSLTFIMPMDVDDAGFRHVGRCAKLQALWCMYCRDTGDEATRHIGGLKLKLYYAGKTRITDESCQILSRMDSLESLEFWQTAQVTDAGIAALARLPRLTKLSISDLPRVTRQGLAVLPSRVRVEYGS